ncbi:MAG: GxxExxY protein [Bacteroidia bacterium]|nr:GxxExxY protein [Bacteroidia bacterium]
MPQKHQNTKNSTNDFVCLDLLGKQIVDAAFTVHKHLGPGLLEKAYEICFCHELQKRGIFVQRQVEIPIVYDNITFPEGLRIDLVVDHSIFCELKAVDIVNPVWTAQILSYMRLTDIRLGYLINFNVPYIGRGIKRYSL